MTYSKHISYIEYNIYTNRGFFNFIIFSNNNIKKTLTYLRNKQLYLIII